MNSLSFKHISYTAVLAVLSVVLFLAIFNRNATVNADSTISAGERLITIHDRGQEKSVITTRTTLRDVFKDASMLVDEHDIIEPGIDEKLVSNNYQVNIYRARPITIVDGKTSVSVMSAQQTPTRIAKDAGIVMHDQDETSLKLSDDIVNNGMNLQMTIKRATPVELVLYGKTETVYTQKKNVGDFLADKSITLGASDTISVPKDTPITSGMRLEIWRNGKQTVTVDEPIEAPVEKIEDVNQPIGYEKATEEGSAGKKSVTYEIVMKNGVEESRTQIQSVVIDQPVKRVIVVGTKVNLPPGSHEDWMAAAGISPSDYGYVNYIVMREGGWEPCKVQGGAINCSYSGSAGYGIVQATPGGKMVSAGSDWRTNPITQLRWATGYANGRYGGWAGAYQHWLSSRNW